MTIHSPAQNMFTKSVGKLCAIQRPVNFGSDSLESKYRICATSESCNCNNLQLIEILAETGNAKRATQKLG